MPITKEVQFSSRLLRPSCRIMFRSVLSTTTGRVATWAVIRHGIQTMKNRLTVSSELPIMEGVQGALGIFETRGHLRDTILLPGQAGTTSCCLTPHPTPPNPASGDLRPEANPSRGPGPGHYLHGSGGSRAAGPDLEEASPGRSCLPPLTGGAALVDDHGLPAKQAHKVGGLLALDHTALARRQESTSGKGAGGISLPVWRQAPTPLQPAWPRLTRTQGHRVCVRCGV